MLRLSAGEKKLPLARKELKEVSVSPELSVLPNFFPLQANPGACVNMFLKIFCSNIMEHVKTRK